jgi:hypothetical protein
MRGISMQISHGGSQGFKSPHLHPQHRRSERRRQPQAGGAHCMFRPRCGRSSSHSPARRLSETPGDSVLGRTMTTQRGHRQLPADGRSSPASRLSPVGHPVDLAHCPTPAHDDDQVEADPPLAQHDLCQPRGPGSNLGQTTRRRGHGGRPRRPRPSQPCGCRPHRHAPRPHSGRTQQTPEPDTGHLDAQTPAPDTDHLDRPRGTPDTRTGHRTPDAGQERGHGDDSTAGVRTSWPPRRATSS